MRVEAAAMIHVLQGHESQRLLFDLSLVLQVTLTTEEAHYAYT
jgi:hypothetical protein